MSVVEFGIVGGGWRTLAYLRIAQELPSRFHVGGVVVRDAAKGRAIESAWQVPTFRTLAQLLTATHPGFVVVSVPVTALSTIAAQLVSHEVPTLLETPPGTGMDELNAITRLARGDAKIQVAEQYQFQPLNAARITLVQSGLLGKPTLAHVSLAHGYHGMSLIRRFLDTHFQNATIDAWELKSKVIAGPGRFGPPTEEKTVPSRQVIARLDFGDRVGVYDFTNDQYFSWIRSKHLLVRGERGEIQDRQVKFLRAFDTPVTFELLRQDTGQGGDLNGYYHKGILAGTDWVYQNPYAPARLNDDEIAIATCLEKMEAYSRGGQEFYSLADAAQDSYLALAIEEALAR